jgi:molecular chaperone GrpE
MHDDIETTTDAQPPLTAPTANMEEHPDETIETQDAPAAQNGAPSNTAEADTGMRDYVAALQAEMEELRARAEEAERKLAYMQAEFQTYRRRRDEQQSDLMKFSNSELLKSLLPIVDNFERAIKAAEQTQNLEALLGGVHGTLKQIHSFLEKYGATPIEAVGKEFDPNFHEAIGPAESETYPVNTVAEEVQRGYVMHGRVLRPALVKVVQE